MIAEKRKKYNIILDLDNTLLSAVPLEDFSWDKKTKETYVEVRVHFASIETIASSVYMS